MKNETAEQKALKKSFLAKILHGITEVVEDENGAFRLYRVPCSLLPKLGVRVNVRSFHPAGSELRFRIGSSPVRFKIRRITETDHPLYTPQTMVPVGIFHGDYQYTWLALQEGDNEIEIKPFQDSTGLLRKKKYRFDPGLTRIILPPFFDLRIVDWEGEMEPPRPDDCPPVRLLSYGSSITQGAYGVLGDETYPAILARELGVDVYNLGFGGGAKLEPEIAEWMAARTDWHFATLELGINVMYMPPEEFREKVRKFLSYFAESPLKRPVFTLDVLPFGDEFDKEDMVQKTADFRRIVREETETTGKPFLIALDYASLLPDLADFSTDLLHPASHAFYAIGTGLAEQIRKQDPGILTTKQKKKESR